MADFLPRREHQSRDCWPTATERLLLRAALLDGEPARKAWEAWRAQTDLDRLDEPQAELLPLLGRNLARQAIETPDAVYFRWLHRTAWMVNVGRQCELAALLQRLHAAGIETMLLKGAALVLSDYADPGLCAMADVDVLVPAAQAAPAMRCLRLDGWRAVGWAPFSNDPERTIPVRHSHAFARGGEQLDLHWHVLWDTCGSGLEAAFWNGARPARVLGIETRVPSPGHRLLHVCVHGARWHRPRHIRWVADAATLLAQKDTIDWDRLIAAAVAGGVVLPLRAALAFLGRTLDMEIPATARRGLERAPVGRVERLRFALQVKRPRLLTALPLIACQQWCFARRSGRSAPILGLPAYLWRLYEVRGLRQARELLAHGLRRLPTG